MHNLKILITDGENRSSLAVTRSLGKRGVRVILASKKLPNISSSSKFCYRAYSVPSPHLSSDQYADSIKKIVRSEGIDVIFPMTELSIYILNNIRNQFPPKVTLACSDAKKMDAVSNKVSLLKLAEKLGVPIPQTFYLSGADDLNQFIDRIKQFPVVIKPALSIIKEGETVLSGGVRYASSKQELSLIYKTNSVLRYPSMIQEKIIGPGTGLFTLYDKNKHLALFSHRRIREKPPTGGVSVVSESVPLDHKLIEYADRLLSAVNWSGVAMVEFKRDIKSGEPLLMEINGRFWGTLQLAIACGIDFPNLYLDYLTGQSWTLRLENNYLIGHRLKWILGCLDCLIIRMKMGNNISQNFKVPSKRKSLIEFLKIIEPNTTFDVLNSNDMRPFFIELKSYLDKND